MNKSLVSIIIPVYNSELYLERCLQSVIRMDYEKIEIIVIDDGSTDDSSDIADSFAEKDERFIVKHTANNGVSSARNQGIAAANGKYLMFVDSDDYVDHDILGDMVFTIENTGSDICIRAQGYQKETTENFEAELDASNLDKILFFHRNYLLYGPTSKLYKTDMIKSYSVHFPEDMNFGEDLLFNMDYLDHVKKLSYIAEPKYHISTENNDSLSRKIRWNMFDVGYRLFLRLQEWFTVHELMDDSVREYLNKRLLGTVYDSVCLIFRKDCNWSIREKRQYLKKIFESPYVMDSVNTDNDKEYSENIISSIRGKQYIKLIIRSVMH